MLSSQIDLAVFTPYWDALKRALVPLNLHGSGVGELGRGFIGYGINQVGAVTHSPSEGSPIDISDGHAAFTLWVNNEHLFDPTPVALFSNSIGGEFIREEDPVLFPEKETEDEDRRSRTLRWVDALTDRMVLVINEVGKGTAAAPYLQQNLTPVLQELFGAPAQTTPPVWPQDKPFGTLIYDVNFNFLLTGINEEPLVTLPAIP